MFNNDLNAPCYINTILNRNYKLSFTWLFFHQKCETHRGYYMAAHGYIEDITWPHGDTDFIFEC